MELLNVPHFWLLSSWLVLWGKSHYFAENKKAFKAKESGEVLCVAPKWENKGVQVIISPTAALDLGLVLIEISICPIGQKAAEKQKWQHDGDTSDSQEEKKADIDCGQDLLQPCVKTQEEANWLTAEIL